MQDAVTNMPWYSDWSFWAVVVAAIAVVLSQVPPIHILFRRAKLDLELYSKISITHKVGNPNFQAHLLLNNVGGRRVRIKSIEVSLARDNKEIVVLPAQNYLQEQNSKENLLITTFSLKPGDEWAHIVNFLNYFDRDDAKRYQEIEGSMLSDIRKNQQQGQEGGDQIYEHPAEIVTPAFTFFREKFIWHPGEYKMKIRVKTEGNTADVSKAYRFSVFESQTNTLSAVTDYFKYGGGLWWDPKIQTGVIIEITEA